MKTAARPRGAVHRAMNTFTAKFCAGLAALVLAGCAGLTSVRTELTTYNDWASAPEDKTYTFSPPLRFRDSLQMKSYEGMVRDELNRLGFHEADASSAKLLVTLRPSLAVYEYNWPRPDPWFYHGYWHRGWAGRGWYGPYADPFFFDMDRVSPIYQRQLQLEIARVSPAPAKRLYEATAVNEGYSSSLKEAMPYLVRSIFADFPGGNGQTRTVVVPKTKESG